MTTRALLWMAAFMAAAALVSAIRGETACPPWLDRLTMAVVFLFVAGVSALIKQWGSKG